MSSALSGKKFPGTEAQGVALGFIVVPFQGDAATQATCKSRGGLQSLAFV
jgi:hypothetical protein